MIRQKIKYLGLGTAILCLIYLSVSMSINFEEIYLKFHAQVADAGYEAKAASIEVSHFPFPKVTLKNVSVPGVFEAQKISISFSILSILIFTPSIDLVQISNISIVCPSTDVIYHEEALLKLFKILPTIPNVDMYNVILTDAAGNATDNLKSVQIYPNSSSDNIIINWTNKYHTNISYNKKEQLEIKIKTIAPYHNIKITEIYNNELKLQSGAITYHINNLKDYIDNNYKDLDLLITQIASSEAATISCDFTPDAGGLLFKNINFVSDSIVMTGTADLFENEKQNIINLHFNKINLTTLLKTPDMDSVILSKQKNELKLHNLNSILNIEADQVLLHGFVMNNINIKASSDEQQLDIQECSGSIQEEGKFNLSGAVTQNQYRSKFNGKINLTYPDINSLLTHIGYSNLTSNIPSSLSLSSDIEATPIDYKLTNLSTKIGSMNAKGSASVKLIGMMPRVNLSLSFAPLDLSSKEYTIITPLIDYFKSLTSDMSGAEYLHKYIPLRKMGFLGNFDITLINPIIDGKTTDKIHFICDTSSGILDFTSIYYQNGKDYFLGTGKLLSTALKPIIRLRIEEGELSTSFLSFSNIIDTINKANKNYAFDKVTLDFAIALNALTPDDKTIKNFYMAAINDDKIFNISGLQGYYNTGGFVSSGNILLDSMTLNLSYAYSNFNINDLNIFYPISVFGIKDGWVSSNGTISTTGDNIAKWLYNLYTKSEFMASTIGWIGFDIDGFASITDNLQYDPANLTKDAKHFLSTGNTDFQKISGKYEMTHGVVKFSDVNFVTKRISGTALASYNIYKSVLDSTTKATFAPAARNRYNTPDAVEFTIHTYGDIASTKKDINLDNVKHMLDLNTRNVGIPYNKKAASK